MHSLRPLAGAYGLTICIYVFHCCQWIYQIGSRVIHTKLTLQAYAASVAEIHSKSNALVDFAADEFLARNGVADEGHTYRPPAPRTGVSFDGIDK